MFLRFSMEWLFSSFPVPSISWLWKIMSKHLAMVYGIHLWLSPTISRVLSVILGIYGIIVVASITSVIVKYYNEVKSEEKETKKIDQNEEPQEEEEPHEEK